MLQIIQMIWNGIGGLGAGTILLKALFILFLGVVLWILCELAKHLINVFAKLMTDGLKYIAIAVRGWPKEEDEEPKRR